MPFIDLAALQLGVECFRPDRQAPGSTLRLANHLPDNRNLGAIGCSVPDLKPSPAAELEVMRLQAIPRESR